MTCPDCGCQAPLTEETTAGYYEPVSNPDFRKEPTMSDLTFTYCNAGNDVNGNPRRGWVVRDGDQVVNFVDEGYEGVEPLRRAYPDRTFDVYDSTWNQTRIRVGEYQSYRKVYG